MNVLESLNALADVHLRALDVVQDFQVFTGFSYDRYAKAVACGTTNESINNARTNTTLSSGELAALLLGYLDKELPVVSLYEVVAHFEAFFWSFLSALLRHNPRALSLGRQVTVAQVLDAADYVSLVDHLIQSEVEALAYKSPVDWFAFLNKSVNLPTVTDADVARFAELKATRDAYIHNRGIANDVYLRKSGALARAQVGAQLPISRPYTYDGADFLRELIRRMVAGAKRRLESAA